MVVTISSVWFGHPLMSPTTSASVIFSADALLFEPLEAEYELGDPDSIYNYSDVILGSVEMIFWEVYDIAHQLSLDVRWRLSLCCCDLIERLACWCLKCQALLVDLRRSLPSTLVTKKCEPIAEQ